MAMRLAMLMAPLGDLLVRSACGLVIELAAKG